ncbi:MAG TPA: acyl carrier protein [Acidimicrobiales bacterium]|nr:acyl carrier protein [Acidimicrobiales bacterium]
MSRQDDVVEILVRETGLSASELSSDWSLIDLGVSSFVIVRVLVAFEEHFDMELSVELMEEAVSLPVLRLSELIGRALGS